MTALDNTFDQKLVTDNASGGWYVQWGRTRDGLDPVRGEAQRRGMSTLLIEHPDQLRLRRLANGQEFDAYLPADDPSDVDAVFDTLRQLNIRPQVVFPGFERYVSQVFDASRRLQLATAANAPDLPFDKMRQRAVLAERAPHVAQPGWWTGGDREQLDRLQYPLVVKPGNGSYGSETFLVQNDQQRDEALRRIGSALNFEGRPFEGVVVEEYVSGVPCSMQGIVIDRVAHVLTVCEQSVLQEDSGGMFGFREVGHLAVCGALVRESFRQLAQSAVDAFVYENGPFHLDLVMVGDVLHFLEMGFRLSGVGIAELVRQVGGYDWAELALATYRLELHDLPSPAGDTVAYRGQITLDEVSQLEVAQTLVTELRGKLAVDVAVVEPLRISEEWSVELPPSVRRDFERRPNIVGRLAVSANARQPVVDALARCAPDRVAFAVDGLVPAQVTGRPSWRGPVDAMGGESF